MCVLLTTFWGPPVVNRAGLFPPDIGARANHASGAPPDEVLLVLSAMREPAVKRRQGLTARAKILKN